MTDLEYFESIESLLTANIKALGKKSYIPKVKVAQDALKVLKDETIRRVLNVEKPNSR